MSNERQLLTERRDKVRPAAIDAYCEELAREFRPRKIVLFGSHAYGEPDPGSDVDLLVILPYRGRPVDQVVKMRSRIRPPFPMDLLVRSPLEIRRRLALGCHFTQEVLSRGRVMYEAADA